MAWTSTSRSTSRSTSNRNINSAAGAMMIQLQRYPNFVPTSVFVRMQLAQQRLQRAASSSVTSLLTKERVGKTNYSTTTSTSTSTSTSSSTINRNTDIQLPLLQLTKTSIRCMKLDNLRMELSFRGMDDKGTRNVLQTRLRTVLDDQDAASPLLPLPKIDPTVTYILRVRGHTTPNVGGAGVGLVLYDTSTSSSKASKQQQPIWHGRIYVEGDRTVFEAEYTAILLGMDYAHEILGIRRLELQSDNDVVVRQIYGVYKTNKESLSNLLRHYEQCKHKNWQEQQQQQQQQQNVGEISMSPLTVGRISATDNTMAIKLARKALATRKSINVEPDWKLQDPLLLELNDDSESFLVQELDLDRVPVPVPVPPVQDDKWKEPDAPAPAPATPHAPQDIDATKTYVLRFDGGARGNPGVAGAGMVLYDEQGQEIWCGWKYHGENSTNNVAEYSGLLSGLKCVQSLGIQRLIAEGDSQLIVRQLNGHYRCKEAKLRVFYDACLLLIKDLDYFEVRHIPRAENSRADWLANHAMDLRESDGVLQLKGCDKKPVF
jgi:ribonuclease HI